jgi:EAL domain-containing protein (putative c-di-GMP-specific phosphodiesterase class I)/PAS domain-containing protein
MNAVIALHNNKTLTKSVPLGLCMKEKLNHAEQVIELQKETIYRLETIVHNVTLGIAKIDAHGHVILQNQRFMELMNLTQAFMEVHPTYQQILNYQHRNGAFGDKFELIETTARESIAGALAGAQSYPAVYITKTRTGRVLSIKTKDLPKGGKMITCEDITSYYGIQEELKEILIRFHSLTEMSSDWYLEQDGQFRFTRVDEHTAFETDMQRALLEKQFILHYQPQVSKKGHLTGAEVLVRWLHPTRGLMLPSEFICLAEQTGFILPLGLQVLEAACAQLVLWAASPDTEQLTLAVNVSAPQIHQPDFANQVLALLDFTGVNPSRLKLEITESMLLKDIENTCIKMKQLKRCGVTFSLDDFGTGYSSLTYLKRLPLDQLKIDQTFVRDLMTDSGSAAIVRGILSMGHSMGLNVIAEGVETEEQRDYLSQHGCTAYQGYLFGRPGPVENLWAANSKIM